MSTAVVTGGGGGLGQAFAEVLARAGYDVITADLVGAARHLDVTDADACQALADEAKPQLWVNNAGVTGRGDVLDQSDTEVERIVAVNLLGVVHGSRAAASSMLARSGGTILNVASLSGWAPTPHIAVYSGAKHGVRAFSVAFAAELRDTQVTVRCLLPDGIRTPMVDIHDPRQLMSFTGPRLLEPEEVARAGLRLARSHRLVASVPRRRGLVVRSLGISPRVGSVLQRTIERRARRNQTRAAARATGE